MLRRLAGEPMKGENYFKAEIVIGRVGILLARCNLSTPLLPILRIDARARRSMPNRVMGASDGEIVFQFLIESMTLSTIGAAIGGGMGVLLLLAIGSNFPAGLPISGPGILMAGSFAISIGLAAGLYPSLVASRLEPVEALRA